MTDLCAEKQTFVAQLHSLNPLEQPITIAALPNPVRIYETGTRQAANKREDRDEKGNGQLRLWPSTPFHRKIATSCHTNDK
jgi:hypothetical protein